MNSLTLGGRWAQALRHLPAPLLGALDAWSLRLARRRAEKRRLAACVAAASR